MDVKPFSQACMNNREPILRVLKRAFASVSHVLEVGSGTGQHAVYFAKAMPHLQWQTSDLPENLPGIRLWLEDEPQENLPEPLALSADEPWPDIGFDAIFSANTAHIMPWPTVEQFIHQAASSLPPGGIFALYGPFNYGGTYTSESNARFDTWLKAQNPERAIRDFEKVDTLAGRLGLVLQEDNAMPANNRLLVWHKQS